MGGDSNGGEVTVGVGWRQLGETVTGDRGDVRESSSHQGVWQVG